MARNTKTKRNSTKHDTTADVKLDVTKTIGKKLLGRKTRRVRITGEQVMVLTMFVDRLPTFLDVVKIPAVIARDPETAQEFADSYKRMYVATNPSFAKNKFMWQVKGLR